MPSHTWWCKKKGILKSIWVRRKKNGKKEKGNIKKSQAIFTSNSPIDDFQSNICLYIKKGKVKHITLIHYHFLVEYFKFTLP